jgi:uncharacterized protein YndB with AHSA1/START domain
MPELQEVGTTSTADREIVATRLFHAPRELVFKMWTDREHISNWCGLRLYDDNVRNGRPARRRVALCDARA